MYTPADLSREIAEQHRSLFESNEGAAPKSWLVRSVLALHQDIAGEDADFAHYCAQLAVAGACERYIRDIKENEQSPTDSQMVMEGFKFLQKQYVNQRDGESAIVGIHAMTDEEIRTKAAQHRAMGAGHYRHAEELDRYLRQRYQAA